MCAGCCGSRVLVRRGCDCGCTLPSRHYPSSLHITAILRINSVLFLRIGLVSARLSHVSIFEGVIQTNTAWERLLCERLMRLALRRQRSFSLLRCIQRIDLFRYETLKWERIFSSTRCYCPIPIVTLRRILLLFVFLLVSYLFQRGRVSIWKRYRVLLAHAANVKICLDWDSSSICGILLFLGWRLNCLLVYAESASVLIIRGSDSIVTAETSTIAESIVDQVAIVLSIYHILNANMVVIGTRSWTTLAWLSC